MSGNHCLGPVCFYSLDASAPKFFGFSDFLVGLALMVLAWTIADIRYRFRIRTAPVPLQGTLGTNWAVRDAAVIAALNAALAERARWGFWKCYDRMRNLGHSWNHKRVHRVYCRMKLNLPRRTKRRPPQRERQPLTVVPRMNVVWALDFMRDTLYGGKVFRTLNVIDEANRGALGIDIAVSIP